MRSFESKFLVLIPIRGAVLAPMKELTVALCWFLSDVYGF